MLTLVTLQPNRNGINIITIPVRFVLTLLCMQLSIAIIPMEQTSAQDRRASSNATPTSSHPYRTPNAVTAIQTLNAPCDQVVDKVPLGELLDQLAAAYKVELLCDRRVAIDHPITIEERTKTLRELLDKSASQVDCELAIMDKLIVLIPSQKRDAIESSYWKLAALGPNHALNRIDKKGFDWPDGAIASEVIHGLFTRFKLDKVPLPEIPNDVWRARQFRDVTPASIISLLLGSFDLRLEINPNSEADTLIVSQQTDDDSPTVEWIYDDDTIKNKIGSKLWQAWREKWPQATVEQLKQQGDNSKRSWKIRTTAASHRDLIEPLIPPKKWETPAGSKKQFSGKFAGRLDEILQALAQAASLTVAPWPLPDKVARTEVSLTIKDATIDSILSDISKRTGFDLQRSGNQIAVKEN